MLLYIILRYIDVRYEVNIMSIEYLKKKLAPMTEATYYTLLSLLEPKHGYGIMQFVTEISNGRLKLGPGTLYGILGKMHDNKVIKIVKIEGKRKIYCLTDIGLILLQDEISRLEELYRNGYKQINKHVR